MAERCTTVKVREEERAALYRAMARHFAGLSDAYKTLHKWAEEEAVIKQ